MLKQDILDTIKRRINRQDLYDLDIPIYLQQSIDWLQANHDFSAFNSLISHTGKFDSLDIVGANSVRFVRLVSVVGTEKHFTYLNQFNEEEFTGITEELPLGYFLSGNISLTFDAIPTEDVLYDIGFVAKQEWEDLVDGDWFLDKGANYLIENALLMHAYETKDTVEQGARSQGRNSAIKVLLKQNARRSFSDRAYIMAEQR